MKPPVQIANPIMISVASLLLAAGMSSVVPELRAAPVKGTGTWTLYYVYEATGKESSSGPRVTIIATKGEKLRVRVSPPVLRKANLEGTVTSKDPKDGKRYVTNFTRLGLWEDLPDGWEGKGNRSNPLSIYRSVAADQKHHSFGSRIFVDYLVGFTPPGFDEPHDGYLWVSDTGGGIKGSMRFDLFVGRQSTYDIVMELEKQKGKWKVPIEIEKLSAAPGGYSPKTDSGLRKILAGLGLLKGDSREAVTDALTAFQKQHKHIPEPEYGSARGAITMWYLTQAAIALAAGEPYDAEVAGSRPKSE